MSFRGPRARWVFVAVALVASVTTVLYLVTPQQRSFNPISIFSGTTPPAEEAPPANANPPPPKHEDPIPDHPTPRVWPEHQDIPVHESFPEGAAARTHLDLPRVPSWNTPPAVHVSEDTPLFIGFTRNFQMLQQAVVSYIAAGWPPEDIYVVENTGVMDSNQKHRLTEENPFYLDHTRLSLFGVNILITPTYLSFAQLQNFYLYEAIKNKYATYFWSHMDVVALAQEDFVPYKSFYMRAVDALREAMAPGFARDGQGREGRWTVRFFAYDWLTLVNTATAVELGGWDTMIPYYKTDCDMYERNRMAGMGSTDARCGKIWDVASILPDLGILYRRKTVAQNPGSIHDVEEPIDGQQIREEEESTTPAITKRASATWTNEEDERNSTAWHELWETLRGMEHDKGFGTIGRNRWQRWQTGGQGQPFYKDVNGFEESLKFMFRAGEDVYQSKWGHIDCYNPRLRSEDAWHVNQWRKVP